MRSHERGAEARDLEDITALSWRSASCELHERITEVLLSGETRRRRRRRR
jgi:hypothetical protein